jgi:hypothetical protein
VKPLAAPRQRLPQLAPVRRRRLHLLLLCAWLLLLLLLLCAWLLWLLLRCAWLLLLLLGRRCSSCWSTRRVSSSSTTIRLVHHPLLQLLHQAVKAGCRLHAKQQGRLAVRQLLLAVQVPQRRGSR